MNDLPLPTSSEKISEILNRTGIQHEIYEHEAVFTVQESTKIHQTIDGGHCRNLFLKDKKGRLVLVTALDNTAVDLKGLASTLEHGRFSFASAERLWDHLGVRPGSVTPLALYNETPRAVLPVLDSKMFEHERICVHPLINTKTICLCPKDLVNFLESLGYSPIIIDMDNLG